MISKRDILGGCAVFAMFFGSGNLVFPILLGAETQGSYLPAAGGLLLTGVVLPLLGLLSVVMCGGCYKKYFNTLGPRTGFFIGLLIIALLGPLGVVPRCITVAYSSFQILFPSVSLTSYSLAFCLLIVGIAWRKMHIVDLIGKWLTPLLLTGIAGIFVTGISGGTAPTLELGEYAQSFTSGLKIGYQNMDLFAAFLFGATAFSYMKHHYGKGQELDNKTVSIHACKACLVGACILGVATFGLTMLGAHNSASLAGAPRGALLTAIASMHLGVYASVVSGLVIFLACLSTAAILLNHFSEYVSSELTRGKLSRHSCIIGSGIATFAVSLVGFDQLCNVLGIVLEIAYPAVIAFTLISLMSKVKRFGFSRSVFWTTLTATFLFKVYALI